MSAGVHDPPLQTVHRHSVARLRDRVSDFRVQLRVLLQDGIDLRAGLYVRSMVDELLNRDSGGQLGKSPNVIAVKVRGNQVIDAREPRVLHGRHDAIRIARRAGPAIARIDQHRFTRRRHVQLGVAAFDVDDVDVEGLRRAGLRAPT